MTTITAYTKQEVLGAAFEAPVRKRKLGRKSGKASKVAPRRKKRPERQSDERQNDQRQNDQRQSDDQFAPANESRRFFNWGNIIWLVILHTGCLAAPFFFTWEAVVLTVALHWLTGGIGICLGFHRHLTHLSFTTYRPVRWLLAFIGGLAGEGSVIDWVANHRKHHAHSDQDGDPHSPHEGPWWSHMFWLGFWEGSKAHESHIRRWVPDLLKDPVLRWIGAMFLPSHFLAAGAIAAAGYAYGGWPMATSFVVWGVFVRLVFVLHSTWFVNSASHMWGYRNYETTDDSRNNWWVALITYGEGWHNNHHAYPRMAPHGHKWWEFDMTFITIRLMQLCGVAWDVVDYKKKADKLAA